MLAAPLPFVDVGPLPGAIPSSARSSERAMMSSQVSVWRVPPSSHQPGLSRMMRSISGTLGAANA